MRALVVEDDEMIGKALGEGLRGEGWAVDWMRDGNAAQTALLHEVHDLVLLDLGLPGKDGLAVLKAMRAKGSEAPVIIITARDAVEDRIAGLNAGADDYIVKPFDFDELLARARAVQRRRAGRASPELSFGALRFDPVKREVAFRGSPVELSPREFAVLEALARDPGAVVSRAKLEDSVYGWGEEVGSNSVEVHLHHLRRKLAPQLIRNVRGVGYQLVELD